MSRVSNRLAGVLLVAGALAVASGTAGAGVVPAAAATHPEIHSGDPRATAHRSHGSGPTCDRAGLGGSPVTVSGSLTSDRSRLTVTAVPAGVTVTGVVVQGVLAYNVYPRAALGALPYQGLRAPSFGPEGVLRWFACGVAAPQRQPSPTPTTPPTTPPTTTAPPTTGPATPTPTPAVASLSPSDPLEAGDATGPPGDVSAGPQKASQDDLGASVYLAVAMLLVVSCALLTVPRRFGVPRPGSATVRRRG